MNNVTKEKDFTALVENPKKLKKAKEFFTFVFVGTSNTILEALIMNFLWWISGLYEGNINYLFKFITFIICSIVGYFMNQKLTFKSKNGLKDYFKYAIVLGFLSLLEAIVIAEFTKIHISFIPILLWANIVSVMASGLIGILNFFISKFLIFKVN